ncbi:putative flippase GtrA [Kineosphaera limosa]|uniref:dolichyl-phosphate beta-glucosyltransferase n=1 Tax=Kineosphaera limosa NBRC 100340 TaxID=1184609 RepID=K6WXR7_9MICO|nr:glycosyltransferase [Kineosphaera limosa]NYE00301.1 putative flippase GtrA [Kineosphaera limosa]GAB96872.1 putative glycosyltransferase [Kineosphaera limosa NBRC 100340]
MSTTIRPVLDVVVPVYNEQAGLAACVQRLTAHLETHFPYPWRVTVADNASTDATLEVARMLAARDRRVRVVHLEQKGRGRALNQVWSASDAHILAYMDVDLSTDLDALWPLVAPLMSGHSDLAIGTRLAHGARVVRGAKREFISRSYNLLLRTGLDAGFSDAQCGFKAIRADVAAQLLPHVQDTAWFFDTELLVIAERAGLRIHEVPVDWFDDPDSRVDVVQTALDDLRGMRSVRQRLASGDIPVEAIAASMGRGQLRGGLGRDAWRFAGVGAASTVVHLGLFAALGTAGLALQLANALALVVATMFNTAANRRFTFGARGREGALRLQVQGLAIFALTWAFSAAAIAGLAVVAPSAPTWVATGVVGAASVAATLAKFALFRSRLRPAGKGHFLLEPQAAPAMGTVAAVDTAVAAEAAEAVEAVEAVGADPRGGGDGGRGQCEPAPDSPVTARPLTSVA